MISTLNLTDKLALNQLLAASIAKEIGTGAPVAVVAGKKAKDPNAPKRGAAPGVLAWNAFIKHCKSTKPTLFEGIKLEKDRLAICGSIKEKDLPAYQAWVAEFIKNLPAAPASAPVSAPTSDTEEKPEEAKPSKPKKVKTEEQKAADKQKRKEKSDAKKAVAAPAPSAPASATEGDMIQKTIKGKHYLMDPESGNLYATDSKYESVGDYVGKFNATDDASPIDFDAEE